MSGDAGRLRLNDALRVTSVGLRARPLRAALSALGIAIGTAAIVAVLGLSSSSQAGLLAEIDRLGTNMLTLEAGQSVTGQPSKLPLEAPARITPLVGRSSVPMMCSSVDLPDPEGPTIATSSPLRTEKDTPRRAGTGGSSP